MPGSRRREQVLLLLNRRGFAAAVFCRQCGRSLECPNCSVSLTFHRSAGRARCHYCGYSRTRPVDLPGLCRTLSRTDRFRHRTGRDGGRWSLA